MTEREKKSPGKSNAYQNSKRIKIQLSRGKNELAIERKKSIF